MSVPIELRERFYRLKKFIGKSIILKCKCGTNVYEAAGIIKYIDKYDVTVEETLHGERPREHNIAWPLIIAFKAAKNQEWEECKRR